MPFHSPMIITNHAKFPWKDKLVKLWKRPGSGLAILVFLLLLVSAGMFVLILSGKTRRQANADTVAPVTEATSTALIARHLDGVLVPRGSENLVPRAFMIDNQVDARPSEGLAAASVVIEAPVEGGITRFLALLDGKASVSSIGPVRSSRPYYVEWADGWDAAYFHVGGSGEALELIRRSVGSSSKFLDVNEMVFAQYFWRSSSRPSPHQVFSQTALMDKLFADRAAATTTSVIAWHFQDAATTTERGEVKQIKIPYGGSYNVVWNYSTSTNSYARSAGGRPHVESDGTRIATENVIVIKTDSQILDEVGRLRVRTVGGGEAIAYKNGNKYPLRWSRSTGEPIRFTTVDGNEFPLTRGRTWIEVTTDDRIFAGIGI